ncbi:hypothetical protein CDV31_005224 [Fusarium ambrosium]|uniref:SMP-30/Gluconolactonase/LRE-like region domain-containing protein n=1 Tax=Fusarium ambrosium TaxID=131363 RepID=A0A428UKM8_9HYPO|nr:hypothetical protein CDV31_005224 [Fusarium ambrosium]
MSTRILNILALIPAFGQFGSASVLPSHTPGLLVGPSIVQINPALQNVFPAENFNRNITTSWWDTDVVDGPPSSSASKFLASLKQANFIALDDRFYELLGVKDYTSRKDIEVIFDFPEGPSFAKRLVHDGTVYSPECNCIFYAELHPPKQGYSADAMPWVWRTNLNHTRPVTEKVYPSPPLTMANGAYYHNGSVYWAQEGSWTVPGGIVRMDPLDLKTEVVLNNFFGHRFNSPNDIVIKRDGVAFFTDGYYGYDNFNDTLEPELANGVWRWDMHTGSLRMVLGAGGGPFTNPNGVALNLDEDELFITNRGNASDNPAGGRTIYQYHISSTDTVLSDDRVFTYVDAGFPDGIKTDSEGRVYGAVTGGVHVFDADGTFLGIIKVVTGDVAVNMQWVEDTLYIVGREHLYSVQLNTTGSQLY